MRAVKEIGSSLHPVLADSVVFDGISRASLASLIVSQILRIMLADLTDQPPGRHLLKDMWARECAG
jgi:hypothetical protein